MVENTDTSKWYVVHCHSGFEKKVADSILDEAKKVNLEDSISEVSVPTQAVVEVRRGVRVNSEKKFFPGYVLIKMIMNDDTWHLVRDIPKVSNFLGTKISQLPYLNERYLNYYKTLLKVLIILNLSLSMKLVNRLRCLMVHLLHLVVL